jgi:alanine racemase
VTRFRPTVAVVDLEAIRHNLRTLKPPGAQVMAVVKADAYGHGDVEVSRAALQAGATWLGVALVEEGLRLRDAAIDVPVLVLSEFPPGSEKEALTAGLTPSLYTGEGLRRLAEAAAATGAPVGVHVKIDTGMHRLGLDPGSASGFARRTLEAGLQVEGLWTHFAQSEDLDDPFTTAQLERFLGAARALRAKGVVPRYLHAANSAAIMALPDTHLDLVRLGVALYGLSPGPSLDLASRELRRAMSWRSAVSMAKRVEAGEGLSYGLRRRLDRTSTIATVPVGYADGYDRLLSDRADVLIGGRRRRVAGTITMDHILVDCGDDPVEAGDEVVLLGRQGREEITAEELANLIGTIGYEIVCAIGGRVPREYPAE